MTKEYDQTEPQNNTLPPPLPGSERHTENRQKSAPRNTNSLKRLYYAVFPPSLLQIGSTLFFLCTLIVLIADIGGITSSVVAYFNPVAVRPHHVKFPREVTNFKIRLQDMDIPFSVENRSKNPVHNVLIRVSPSAVTKRYYRLWAHPEKCREGHSIETPTRTICNDMQVFYGSSEDKYAGIYLHLLELSGEETVRFHFLSRETTLDEQFDIKILDYEKGSIPLIHSQHRDLHYGQAFLKIPPKLKTGPITLASIPKK